MSSLKAKRYGKRWIAYLMIVSLLSGSLFSGWARAQAQEEEGVTDVLSDVLKSEWQAATATAEPAWNQLAKIFEYSDFEGLENVRVTPDGQYVAYLQNKLEGAEFHSRLQLFDRKTGTQESVLQDVSGFEAVQFEMTPDARWFALIGKESIFSQENAQVYLFDRTTKEAALITKQAGGTAPANGMSGNPAISADGRYVAYDSSAADLVPGDTDNRDVFVYDRDSGMNAIISAAADLDGDYSERPSISADGRYVAFESDSQSLAEGDDDSNKDVFIHDRTTGTNRLISGGAAASGEPNGEESGNPKISADGSIVAFESESALTPDDGNELKDIYVYRASSNAVERVSVAPNGSELEYDSADPWITADGQYVTFDTTTDSSDMSQPLIAMLDLGVTKEVAVDVAEPKLMLPVTDLAIGDGAEVAVFSAGYGDAGADPDEPTKVALFVASKAKPDDGAPKWPQGSKLEASDVRSDRATLSWTPATAAGGVKSYRVFANDEKVADVDGALLTYTAEGLKPATVYIFRVEAVSADNVATTDGPVVRVDTPADDRTLELSLSFDKLTPDRLPKLGSTMKIKAKAMAGRAISAEIAYETWLDESDARLPAPRATSSSIELAETQAGSGEYAATFPVKEGISRMLSVTAVMQGAAGGPVEKAAAGLPLVVPGNLQIAFDNPGQVELDGAYLTASNPNGNGASIRLGGAEPVKLEGLAASSDYTVSLMSEDGKSLGQQADVEVSAGWTSAMTFAVKQPVRLTFEVRDQDGNPVPGVYAELWDEAQENYLTSAVTDEDGRTDLIELEDAAPKYTVKANLTDPAYDELAPLTFPVAGGDQTVKLAVKRTPEGKLKGRVLDPKGQPIANAQVSATQMHKGKPVVRNAYTGPSGTYELTLYAGEAAIQAGKSSFNYFSEEGLKADIVKGETKSFDISLTTFATGQVTLKVHLKPIGGDWQGPIDMEALRFSATLMGRTSKRVSFFHNIVMLQGLPGDNVEVCVNGAMTRSFTECTHVVLDADANATAELWVEEKGGFVSGSFDANVDVWTNVALYDVSGGSQSYVDSQSYRGGSFLVHAPTPGTYKLEVTRRDPDTNALSSATAQVTVRERETVNVGKLTLVPASYFTSSRYNGFMAEPSEVSPGAVANLRAYYQNGAKTAIGGAVLRVELPSGVTPVSEGGSVFVRVNGETEKASVKTGALEVQLGDIAPYAKGTVLFQAKLASDYSQGRAKLTARIAGASEGKALDEALGTAVLEVPSVTIEAPETVSSANVKVGGLAPASSRVNIYDEQMLLASVNATSAGTWQSEVQLSPSGSSDMHLLWAEAVTGDRTLRTKQTLVSYDEAEPTLQTIDMVQYPDGKWVRLEVAKGMVQLPYTVVPGNPFAFVLKFDKPDRVKNVKVYLAGQIGRPVTAEKHADGEFWATVPSTPNSLGGLYVSYDTVKPKAVITRDIPTEAETNALLPPAFRNFKIVEKTPFTLKDDVYAGKAVFEFPGAADIRLEASERIDLTPTSYFPTVEEIVQAEEEGIPMYNVTFETKETENGIEVKMKGYMPKGYLFPEDNARSGLRAMAAFDGDLDPLEMLDEMGIDATPYQKGMIEVSSDYKMISTEASDPLFSVKDQYEGYKGYAGKVMKIMENIESSTVCPENMEATGEQAGKALLATVGGEIAKTALGAWTGAMMLEGPVGFLGGYASKYVTNKIDSYVDEQIGLVGSAGPTDPSSCRDDDEDLEDLEEENIYKKKLKKKARIKWIYDPSGYVYEAVPANRLEQVKATVLFKESGSGMWKVWNEAPEYGQINPQYTDAQGRYGWDVPEGVWKVAWEKPGYETTYSEELKVPPPHFDVNAGLVSKAPPTVVAIEAIAGSGEAKGYIDVTFGKYLKADAAIADGTVVVTGPEGAVAGTVAFAETQEAGGAKLARKIRFTPTEGALAEGAEYGVDIQPAPFVSYADAKMPVGASQTVKAVLRDAKGPVPTSAKAAGGNAAIRIQFDEGLSQGAVLAPEAFTLSGTNRTVQSAVVEMPAKGGQPQAAILTLSGPIAEANGVEVHLAAGAAADALGNPSGEATLRLSGPNAKLSGLEIAGGKLTEAFSPDKTDYTVQVGADVAKIELKATLAQAGGKLSVRDVPLADGEFRAIGIPSDGLIPIAAEAANYPDVHQVYTLKIVRVSEPGPGPGPEPGSGSGNGGTNGGDPADIGRDAEVTGKETGGRKQAVVSLKAATVLAALKAGQDGSELYLKAPAGYDAYDIVIPAEAYRALAGAKAKMLFKFDSLSVAVRTDGWQAMGDKTKLVHLIVERAAENDERAWVERLQASSNGIDARTGLYRFALTAESDSAPIPLAALQPDALSVQWAGVANDDTAGLYRYDSANQSWRFVAEAQGAAALAHGGETDVSAYYGVAVYASPFTDIGKHWAKADIDWLATRLYVKGVSADAYQPNRSVTRAEFAALLVRIAGDGASDTESLSFNDVKPSDWYNDPVRQAAALGLINGDGSGKFRPNERITREQMASMAWRAYAKLVPEATTAKGAEIEALLQPFGDQDKISPWARAEVASAVRSGLMQGASANRFDSSGIATRAQAATLVKRLAERLGDRLSNDVKGG
ncbi:Periplasmic component of the Tol biopolymer transport system [Cohnella sp. OV330]|uniref:S-layer homology domain-containing protein n=1 Tax=Cohnella sp. OV330 TaxID=1855288 RepID=UPI0008EB6CFE|nr:S-layer homology domain-containing protein [Cohnella sp. OV330]SFB03452.1 Periplasmic component of the Tol biopolymer transport system [Cohnella sp. OV330]